MISDGSALRFHHIIESAASAVCNQMIPLLGVALT
jgi:hypothetical protein